MLIYLATVVSCCTRLFCMTDHCFTRLATSSYSERVGFRSMFRTISDLIGWIERTSSDEVGRRVYTWAISREWDMFARERTSLSTFVIQLTNLNAMDRMVHNHYKLLWNLYTAYVGHFISLPISVLCIKLRITRLMSPATILTMCVWKVHLIKMGKGVLLFFSSEREGYILYVSICVFKCVLVIS